MNHRWIDKVALGEVLMVRKAVHCFLTALVLVQLIGCGTILYPERRGQAPGQYDADVVFLDAAGLLLFVVPGVVAFAVDFVTGAIYLPPGEKSKIMERLGSVGRLELDPAHRDVGLVARTLERETGLRLRVRSVRVDRDSESWGGTRNLLETAASRDRAVGSAGAPSQSADRLSSVPTRCIFPLRPPFDVPKLGADARLDRHSSGAQNTLPAGVPTTEFLTWLPTGETAI